MSSSSNENEAELVMYEEYDYSDQQQQKECADLHQKTSSTSELPPSSKKRGIPVPSWFKKATTDQNDTLVALLDIGDGGSATTVAQSEQDAPQKQSKTIRSPSHSPSPPRSSSRRSSCDLMAENKNQNALPPPSPKRKNTSNSKDGSSRSKEYHHHHHHNHSSSSSVNDKLSSSSSSSSSHKKKPRSRSPRADNKRERKQSRTSSRSRSPRRRNHLHHHESRNDKKQSTNDKKKSRSRSRSRSHGRRLHKTRNHHHDYRHRHQNNFTSDPNHRHRHQNNFTSDPNHQHHHQQQQQQSSSTSRFSHAENWRPKNEGVHNVYHSSERQQNSSFRKKDFGRPELRERPRGGGMKVPVEMYDVLYKQAVVYQKSTAGATMSPEDKTLFDSLPMLPIRSPVVLLSRKEYKLLRDIETYLRFSSPFTPTPATYPHQTGDEQSQNIASVAVDLPLYTSKYHTAPTVREMYVSEPAQK